MNVALNTNELDFVVSRYGVDTSLCEVSPLGNGLINSTYLVKSDEKTFVLQQVNQSVFTQAKDVISNAELIDQHLIAEKKSGAYSLESISQLQALNGEKYVEVAGQLWRALLFIPNCYTVEAVETAEQAGLAATAFAQFTSALSSFPAEDLAVIIPDFHNLQHRVEQLKASIEKNASDRLQKCQFLVDEVLQQGEFIQSVAELTAELPLHVTHNDTKINNLLFCRESTQPIAVIDLDTCMPGYLMHDFGDMVRTCCSNLPEDGENIAAMEVRFDIFDALMDAYIKGFGDNISELEKQSLVVGAQLLPLMIGVRFLTDYLDGDRYFHTQHDEHNLVRAKNQFQLYSLLHAQADRLQQAIG